jgi:hypothetical protein
MANVSEAAAPIVTLRGGLAVPVDAVLLLLNLEARGVRLEHVGADIVIYRGSPATDEDRVAPRRYKPHILALLDYVEAVAH